MKRSTLHDMLHNEDQMYASNAMNDFIIVLARLNKYIAVGDANIIQIEFISISI